MSPTKFSIFKLTVAIAAIDNFIDEHEHQRIRKIGANMEIPDDLIEKVIKKIQSFENEKSMVDWLAEDIVVLGRQPEALRQGMLDSMTRSAKSDGVVSAEEDALLHRCMRVWKVKEK